MARTAKVIFIDTIVTHFDDCKRTVSGISELPCFSLGQIVNKDFEENTVSVDELKFRR